MMFQPRSPRLGAPALVVLLTAGLALAAGGPAFQLVVNPQVHASSLDRDFVAKAFLKRASRWPDGTFIHPVDLGFESRTREAFTEDVFGRGVNAVRNTWLQAIFDGTGVPPPELASDEAVLEYVRTHPGAIGYVSASAKTDGVRTVTLR